MSANLCCAVAVRRPMSRLSPRWRRFWRLRLGQLRRPGRAQPMDEPVSGPRSRSWDFLHGLLRHRPVTTPATPPHVTAPDRPSDLPEFPLSLVADDDLGEDVKEHAREVLLRVARLAPHPVLHARITLHMQPDPALAGPAVAKASLDVSGRPVRAHIAAGQMLEAIDLLERRLRRNLEDLEELARAHRHETGTVPPGEWRHGSLPAKRPEYFPRPPEERELIRRKTFALSALTPERAALEMYVLDSDFLIEPA